MGGRDRLRETFFLNSDIEFRHLYFPPGFDGTETVDEMLARARRMWRRGCWPARRRLRSGCWSFWGAPDAGPGAESSLF